jgi:hypothetical protein
MLTTRIRVRVQLGANECGGSSARVEAEVAACAYNTHLVCEEEAVTCSRVRVRARAHAPAARDSARVTLGPMWRHFWQQPRRERSDLSP